MSYEFKIWTNRWGHYDHYNIDFTEQGWNVIHMAINGPSEPNGEGSILINFKQDNVHYPIHFGNFLEYLWGQIKNKNISDPEEIQKKLDDVAEWVNTCEQSVPKWPGYNI